MRRHRFTEEQISALLKDAKTGLAVKDLRREHGISEQNFERWRTKYGGVEVNDAQHRRGAELAPLSRGGW